MAYTPNTLQRLHGKPNDPMRVWAYRTEDAMSTVRGADYFSDAIYRGMKVGDVVHVQTVNGSGVPQAHNISVVLTADADGADLTDGTAVDLTNT